MSQSEIQTPRKRRTCLRWGCIGCVVLTLLIIAGIITLRIVIKSDYSDEQWQQIQEFETKVISLPKEWHLPATLPPLNIVSFFDDFHTSTSQLLDQYDDLLFVDYSHNALLHRLLTNDPLTADEETSLTQFLADLQPLLDETSRTVRLPGYTAELDLYGDGAPLNFQIFAKYACIAAHAGLRRGDAVGAMETAAIPLRLTKRPSQSYLSTHLICVAVSAITMETYYALADQTSDAVAIKRGLDLMTEFRPIVFHPEMENWRYSDVLGPLRFAAANGYDVDLSPQSLVDFYQQLGAVGGEYYYEWIIKNFSPDDARVAGAQWRLAALRRPPIDYEELFSQSPEEVEKDLPAPPEPTPEPTVVEPPPDTDSLSYRSFEAAAELVMGIHPHAVLYGVALPNIEEFLTRANTALAVYDLTRLRYARRLEALGAPVGMDSSQSTVTAHLSPIPHDPFELAPFSISEKINQYYSIGPDRVDNNANVRYDATNGTTSAGDLWMGSID